MTCIANANQLPDLPQLPKEVLQRIYSVREPRSFDGRALSYSWTTGWVKPWRRTELCTVWWRRGSVLSKLPAQLQVRALAVCRAWKAHLNPRAWPIEALELTSKWDFDHGHDFDHSIATWVASTQSAVRSLELWDFWTSNLWGMLWSVSQRTVSHVA